MTTEQQQIKEWMQKFGQETPDKPLIKEQQKEPDLMCCQFCGRHISICDGMCNVDLT